MTRATYRELFPDDEEDSVSGDDRQHIAFPWSRDGYRQNRLTSAADAAEHIQSPSNITAKFSQPSSRAAEPRTSIPFHRSATRHATPVGLKRESRSLTPPSTRSAVRQLSATQAPQVTGSSDLVRDYAPEPESVPTRSEETVANQMQDAPALAQHSESSPFSHHPAGNPRTTNAESHPPLSERDLDEILKALSSEGEHGPLFDLDSSIPFPHEEQSGLPWLTGLPQRSGDVRQGSAHIPLAQSAFPQRSVSASLHQHHAHGNNISPSHHSQPPPFARPYSDDPLAMLIQLTHNMQHMSNQVNTLVSKFTVRGSSPERCK